MRLSGLLLLFMFSFAVVAAAETIDFNKIPYLATGERERLAQAYGAAPSPKALVITPEGRWSGTWSSIADSTPDDAVRMALERCEFLYGPVCILYAINMEVTGETAPRASILRKSGAFAPDDVPFVSRPAREDEMKQYAAAPGAKALALHRNGTFGWAAGRNSLSDARSDAMANCRRREPVGCFIYAVNKDVLFEAPRPRP